MESCNTESSLDLPLESLSLQPFLQSLHKEQWQEVRLGEIVDVKHGYAFAGKNITTEHTPNVLVTPGNFHIGGGFKSQKFKYFNGEIPKSFIFSTGDIIVTMTDLSKDGDTLGYSAKIPKDSEHIYLHNQRIGLLLFLRSDICKDFIYWLLRTKNYQAFIVNSATGTSVKHTSPKLIGEYRFPLPPLTIQQKIAEILSSFDDKIDLLHRQNKTLESLALTLFRHYFIDNPKRDEWEEKPLSEIAEIQNGYAFKNSDYTERGMETYEVLKMGHIESGGGLRYFPKAHYVKINDKMTKWVLNEDDIVLAMTDMKDSLGILGYPAMVDKSNYYVLNQRVARIYLKSKDDFLHNYFLFLYLSLQENIQKLQSLANGGVQVNLSTEAIKNFTITIPPLEFQSQNNQAFINIIKKYKNNRKQIQNLQAMRDMLLKAIFA